MAFTAAELAQLKTNQAAIAAADVALEAADIANVEAAQVALAAAISTQTAFINTLVADTTVTPPLTLSLAAIPNQSGTVGVPITPIDPVPGGGTAPYSWGATGLPAGLAINITSGAITGTPTAAVSAAAVVVKLSDSSNPEQTVSVDFTFKVAAAVTPPPTGTITAVQVSTTPSATLGYQIALTWNGFVPVTVGRDGVDTGGNADWSGPLTGEGSSGTTDLNALVLGGTYTGYLIDSNGVTHTASPITISNTTGPPPPTALTIAPIGAQSAVVGVEKTIPITVTGGTPPYTVNVTGLPAGMVASETAITGAPTAVTPAAGVEVTVNVTDSAT